MSTLDDIRSLTQLAIHGQADAFDTIVAIGEMCEAEQRKPKAGRAPGPDTQFASFSEALYERLAQNVARNMKPLSHDNIEAFKQEQHQIIARAAYDLVSHTLSMVPHLGNSPQIQSHADAVRFIPDMPELYQDLPEEASE